MKPRLTVGDTFVFTEEMNKDKSQNGGLYQAIGSNVMVQTLGLDTDSRMQYYGDDGYIYDAEAVDKYLLPRTLEDVKEGDILIDENKNKCLVLGRAGKMVFLSNNDLEPGKYDYDVTSIPISRLKAWDFKFADQPEERWKPEKGEWYKHVDEYGDVSEASWKADCIDNERWNLGNCFKNGSGEAEKAAEELREWWKNRINNQKLK